MLKALQAVHKNRFIKDLCVIEFIAFLLTLIWFRDGLLYGGGEEGLPFYNLKLTLQVASGLWQNSYLGFPSVYQIIKVPLYYPANLAFSLGISGFLIQAFLHFLLFSIGMASVYFLLRVSVYQEFKYRFLPLFGAVFYFLNLYSMSQVWSRGLYMQFIPFATFPLMLLLTYLAVNKQKVIFIFLTLLVSFIFSATFTPAYVLSFWLMIAVVFIYHLILQKNNKSRLMIVFYFLILFLGWIVLHSWWLAALILLSNNLYLSNETVTNEGLGTLLAVSRYSILTSVIRLMQDGYFNGPWLFGKFYQTVFFVVLSWITPVLAVFSIPKIKKSFTLKPFIPLFLLALFICLGASFPLGFLFVWLFNHLTILQLFRDPYEKFGIVLLISFTPFVTVGFFSFSEIILSRYKNVGKYLVGLTAAALLLGLVWPMWTGLVIRTTDSKNLVLVPNYYRELGRWVEQENQNKNRIFMLPFLPGDGVSYIWGGKVYSGIDPMINILDDSVVSFAAGYPYQKDLLAAAYKNIDKLDISNTLGLLRAKYLVIRDDVTSADKRDLRQEQNMLSALYSAGNVSDKMPVVCKNLTSDIKDQDHLTLTCPIPSDLANWQKFRYLHLLVKTDRPAALDIGVRDTKDQKPRWDGTVSPDFRTASTDITHLVLDLNLPVYGDEKFNLANVKQLDILAYPNPAVSGSTLPGQVETESAYLDEGRQIKVDNYQFINVFDKLRLYRLNKYLDFSDVDGLSEVRQVSEIQDMLEDVGTLSEINGQTGYIVKSQNKNFSPFPVFSSNKLIISKLSEYEYLINFPDKDNHYLALHKTFNPFWKVIPAVSERDFKGDVLSDINLLKKATLSENSHFIVNGYANLWKIDGRADSYAIVFLPQIITNILLKISLTVFVLILTAVFIWGTKKGFYK